MPILVLFNSFSINNGTSYNCSYFYYHSVGFGQHEGGVTDITAPSTIRLNTIAKPLLQQPNLNQL